MTEAKSLKASQQGRSQNSIEDGNHTQIQTRKFNMKKKILTMMSLWNNERGKKKTPKNRVVAGLKIAHHYWGFATGP